MAKKHKEDMERERYIKDLGNTPIYVGDPVTPITAESIFGSTFPPSPANVSDSMDVDDTTLLLAVPSSPSPTPTFPFPFALHGQSIPDDDFEPDIDCPHSPKPYDEEVETAALEEEFQAFEGIRYGWYHPVAIIH